MQRVIGPEVLIRTRPTPVPAPPAPRRQGSAPRWQRLPAALSLPARRLARQTEPARALRRLVWRQSSAKESARPDTAGRVAEEAEAAKGYGPRPVAGKRKRRRPPAPQELSQPMRCSDR